MVNLSSSASSASSPEPVPPAVRQRVVAAVSRALGRQYPHFGSDGLDILRLGELVCDGPQRSEPGQLDSDLGRSSLTLVAWGTDPVACRGRLSESPWPAVMEGAGRMVAAFSEALPEILAPLTGAPLLEIQGTWLGVVNPDDAGELELRLRRLAARLLPDLPFFTARVVTSVSALVRSGGATLRSALLTARSARIDSTGFPFVESPGFLARCAACALRPAERGSSEGLSGEALCFVCRARVSLATDGTVSHGMQTGDEACAAVTLRLAAVEAALRDSVNLGDMLWLVERMESALEAGVQQVVSRLVASTGQIVVLRPGWGERVLIGHVQAGAPGLVVAVASEVRRRLGELPAQAPSLGVGLAFAAVAGSRHAVVGRSMELAGLAVLDAEPGACRVDFEVETPELRERGLGHPLLVRSVLDVPGPEGQPERVRLTQRPLTLKAFEAMSGRIGLTRGSASALRRCLGCLEVEGRSGVVGEVLSTLSVDLDVVVNSRGSRSGRALRRWFERGHGMHLGAKDRLGDLMFRREREAADVDFSCGLLDEIELSGAVVGVPSAPRARGRGGRPGKHRRSRDGGDRSPGGRE